MATKRPEPRMDQGVDLAEIEARQLLRQDDQYVTWGELRKLLTALGSLSDDIDPGAEFVG